ncbi:MAG: hypothetical protein H0U10_04740 [Chloroflexia bacterium]|nr:hypothetical protein [Chloroflexia bacterium]
MANDATATIGSKRSTATILGRDRAPRALPEMTKDELAYVIADELVPLLSRRRGSTTR